MSRNEYKSLSPSLSRSDEGWMPPRTPQTIARFLTVLSQMRFDELFTSYSKKGQTLFLLTLVMTIDCRV
jgi:hypothetical protein